MLSLDDVLGIRHPDPPRWSPDGRWLAFGYFVDGVQELRAVPAPARGETPAPGEGIRLSEPGVSVAAWDWSPAGDLAYAAGNDVWRVRRRPGGGCEHFAGFGAGAGRAGAFEAGVRILSGLSPVGALAWSPTASRLALLRADHLLLYADPGGVREIAIGGSPAGALEWSPDGRLVALGVTREGHVDLLVVSTESGETVWETNSPDADGHPVWAADRRLVFLRDSREALWYEWILADLDTGETRVLERVADDRGVSPPAGAAASVAGAAVAVPVPVDGWNHVVVHDLDRGTRTVPLPGEHEDFGHAGDLPAFSPDGRRLVFASSRGSLQERHLWLLDRESGAVRQVTDEPGTQVNPAWSPDGTRLAYVTCGPWHSPEIAVSEIAAGCAAGPGAGAGGAARGAPVAPGAPGASPAMGGAKGEVRLTHSMPEAWTAEEIVEPEHVTIESEGGLVIHADLFVPRGLDTSREHPGLVYVHGGPIRQMRRGWHPMRPYSVFYSFNQLLLQRGYVVISVDYRGGTGYGVEYERANFHQMARADMEDCVAAARHLAALPYVDERRIGIWGLSYGGYMTLACLTKRPDVFAMGINIAGLWDTKQWAEWVAEKAPGHGNMLAARAGLVGPLADADALRESSPRNFVEGLRRPLLNLHGTADGNVDFAQLDRIVEDCTAHGKDFAALYYPGETHMFTKRETWRDAFGRMLDAFDRYLKCDPDERPRAMI